MKEYLYITSEDGDMVVYRGRPDGGVKLITFDDYQSHVERARWLVRYLWPNANGDQETFDEATYKVASELPYSFCEEHFPVVVGIDEALEDSPTFLHIQIWAGLQYHKYLRRIIERYPDDEDVFMLAELVGCNEQEVDDESVREQPCFLQRWRIGWRDKRKGNR